MGAFTLIPQVQAVVGQMSDLQLLVRGQADIDYVVVNLVRVGGRF
jgi:hypothetical protein